MLFPEALITQAPVYITQHSTGIARWLSFSYNTALIETLKTLRWSRLQQDGQTTAATMNLVTF